MALFAALLFAGCATTTPREKVQTGVTQIAFGAPLVLAGSAGVIGAIVYGLTITANSPPCTEGTPAACDAKWAGQSTAAGMGIASGVELIVGVSLLGFGGATLSEGLDEMTTKDDARRVGAAAVETAVEEAAEETQRQLRTEERKQWHPDD